MSDGKKVLDSPDGFDRAPDRYSRNKRETIDRMRDRCYAIAEEPRCLGFTCGGLEPMQRELADLLFSVHCELTSMKYADRCGLKGDAGVDDNKCQWYAQMALHVMKAEVPDPRANRPDFVPYSREEEDDTEELLTEVVHAEDNR